MPRLLSANVTCPREIPWEGKTVHPAIWNRRLNLRRFEEFIQVVAPEINVKRTNIRRRS